ncbi:LysR family transcriptional regulator [Paenibacillus stellifer]|uniref:LysR family transcriptional regulator n=1 Tax=Paenibacillus stellifer TaxID=169760 RepID=UPI001FDF929B|nr:LysR family transcriptional regulator [Paenibacillus stellifer]
MYFPGIEAFLAIVRTESISKAAELLHLSQATVSYRLKTLEKEMGSLLVERRKGAPKISLTPKGENFFSIAERWEALWRETQILQASGSQLSLAISAAESISHFVLPPVYRILISIPRPSGCKFVRSIRRKLLIALSGAKWMWRLW